MREKHDVVIVGAGQAGLSASYWLGAHGREHVIFERAAVAERWRSERWDSLHLQFPNSYLRLPGHPYAGPDPGGFARNAEALGYIEDYRRLIAAPVEANVAVTGLRRDERNASFELATSRGVVLANRVILATGAFQRPSIPAAASSVPAGIAQLHAGEYRNARQLPPGAVLIIGSGSSGCQIAEELRDAGRTVYLSVGRHRRAPHRYRGRLMVDWFRDLGGFDAKFEDLPDGRVPPPIIITGVDGGHSLDVRRFAEQGMVLLGRFLGLLDGRASFDSDLGDRLADADRFALGIVGRVDEYVRRTGLAAAEPDLEVQPAVHLETAARSIDLRAERISTVLWCTGHGFDLGWVQLPILDARGQPVQRRGLTACPGAYFLGLHWMHTFKSGTLYGVGEDAQYLVEQIR